MTVPRTLVLTFDHPITVSAGAIEVYGETRGARAGYSITYNDGKRTVHVEWESPPEGGMSGGANRTVHRWRGQGSFSKGCRDAASEHPGASLVVHDVRGVCGPCDEKKLQSPPYGAIVCG